ncbi:MAG: aldose 1-epimerase family protein [Fluviicoccus sp.]|uniref:aldose 1-epimerase family protein n=1 Tax=Fluviicoccus sp. TaxID=2003552 RepID=UPI002725C18A|nr:aldose 1-epimerase family protein [Fluviicoccus sp.]MDO8330090.1 aldose 1-epimerase family protein [Fluviicoccus sp.]
MRHILSNNALRVEIDSLGAELKSVRSLQENLEYLWQGDTAFWGRTSPVLFPIVGRLTDNTCFIEGRKYSMPQHGLARDLEFVILEQDQTFLSFSLKCDAQTRAAYPYDFELLINYRLQDEQLRVTWQVRNHGTGFMPFAIGAHPGFSTRLEPEDSFEDYDIRFERHQQYHLWPVTPNGRLVTRPVPFLEPLQSFTLNHQYFAVDALVFPDHQVSSVTLKHNWHGHGVTLDCTGFPVLALWTANNQGQDPAFLCIEPWFGFGDTEAGPFELVEKPGMQLLEPGGLFKAHYDMRFF